jgi:hypothetical protein
VVTGAMAGWAPATGGQSESRLSSGQFDNRAIDQVARDFFFSKGSQRGRPSADGEGAAMAGAFKHTARPSRAPASSSTTKQLWRCLFRKRAKLGIKSHRARIQSGGMDTLGIDEDKWGRVENSITNRICVAR